MENKRMVSDNKLSRSLGLFQAVMIVVGTVIGSGVFFKPAGVFKNAGGFATGIAAWVVAGIITMCAALTTAEISTAIPKTGGMFAYLRELYGEKVAFLLGWAQTLIYTPATVAAMSVMFSTFMAELIPMSAMGRTILTLVVIAIMVISNCFSVKIGGAVQSYATVGKLIPLVLMIVAGIFIGKVSPQDTSVSPALLGSGGFGAALIATLWAYDGWTSVTNVAGELKNPKKDLPKSIIIGLAIIISVYVLMNVAIARALPIDNIVSNGNVAVKAAAEATMGSIGAKIISVGILISLYGSMNGYFLSGVRVPFAMGEENLLPFSEKFASVNSKKTPIFANIFIWILATLYALSGTFDILSNLVVFILWIFFVLMVAGIFILRRRKDLVPTYKVPLYPIIPIIGIVGGLYILIASFMDNALLSGYGVLITLLGLLVYWFKKRRS